MATGYTGDPGTAPQGPPPPKKARVKRTAQNPLGATPWGEPDSAPARSAQALIAQLSEAAAPVQEFVQSLIQAIVDGLGVAANELQQLQSDLQVTIANGLTPAAMAVGQMRADAASAIRGQLAQAAEYVSSGTGQPVYYQQDGSLNVVTAAPHPSIPTHPDHYIPGRHSPAIPGMPGTVNPEVPRPNFPINVPAPGPSPGVGAPPPPPSRPPGIPGPVVPPAIPAVPGRPPFPRPGSNPIGPRVWDQASTPGPGASTPGASAPGGVSGARVLSPGGGGGGGGYYWSPHFGGPLQRADAGCNGIITDGSDPPAGSSWSVSNDGAIVWSMPNCSYYDHDPNAPPPSPSPTPTPTPAPINPYDPTNSLPGTPTMPGQPSPTPTGPTGPPVAPDVPYPPAPPIPGQPPTGPPIAPDVPYPPAPPIPPPPDTPCPTGTEWGWTGYQYECIPTYIPPTPLPEPQPTPEPLPEPIPGQPPIGGGGGGGGGKPPACSGKRDDPCWRAANPLDERDIAFHVTAGFARVLAEGKAELLKRDDFKDVQLNIGPGLQDMGGGPQLCDPVYQMSIITGDVELADLIPQFGDLGGWINSATEGKNLADKVVNWTLYAPFVAAWSATFAILSKLSKQIWHQFMGMNQTLGGEIQQKTVLKILNTLTFGAMGRVLRIFDLASNFNFPVEVPSPEAAASAWLANEIDECTFQAYVQAGDYKWLNFRQVARAGKLHFTPIEIMTLQKRRRLERGDLPHRLRELGSLEQEDLNELEALFEQLPGPADITRFMQRDTDNKEVVDTFKLDTGFGDNFNGQLAEWAYNQGVSEDVMRRFWRAHWEIPSPTQLYEMMRRLRHRDEFGGPEKLEADVRLALKQQDILPYWHERLLALAYHPLTYTDVKRAYEKGWIQDDDFKKGMYDNGYSDDDTEALLLLAKRERLLGIRHADFTSAYADGYIDTSTLLEWAGQEGYDSSLGPDIQAAAEFRRRVADWRKRTDAIAAQFRACRITEEEAREDASTLGIPEEVIDRALGIAELHTTCGTRREMVGSLCQALDAGFITPQEYVERMRKLKYDEFAIDTYLNLCQNKIAARKAKELAKQQKDAERAAEKAEREAEREQRQAEAQARRLRKALETQERRRVQRNEKLERAGSKLGQVLSDVDGPDPGFVDGLWRGLQEVNGLSQDDAANVLVITSAAAKGMTASEYRSWVFEVAPLALTDPWQLFSAVPAAANGHS